jgi:small nuclear ribonucleoprotein (snRNP)-like protein
MSKETTDHLDSFDELLNILINEVEVDEKKVYLKEEFEKFFVKGNKSAGTRVRKIMQMIRKKAENIRKNIQDYKKDI